MSQSGSVITLTVHDPDPRASDEASAASLRRRSHRDITEETPAGGHLGFDLATEYDAHGPALFGYAINSLHDRGLAEDCVQETFLRAWRARARFDVARASARTWLFAIQRNVIIDLQRSRSRVARLTTSEPVDDLPAPAADELERLRVVEAVAKLTPEHREVVVAVHLIGESYSELSARSGVPVATLRTRAFYALRALRDHLDGQEVRNG